MELRCWRERLGEELLRGRWLSRALSGGGGAGQNKQRFGIISEA